MRVTPNSAIVPAVDGTSIVDTNDVLSVADGGITAAKIATGAALKLLATGTLGVANATISATVTGAPEYLRVIFYGVTTGDVGASTLVARINAVATNYFARLNYTTVATIGNVTSTVGIPLQGTTIGVAQRVAVVMDVHCPSGGKKMVTAQSFITEAGTESSSILANIVGESDDTADVTGISFVLPGSTWTTASKIEVYG